MDAERRASRIAVEGGRIRPAALVATLLAAAVLGVAALPGLDWPAHGALVVLTIAAGLWMTEAIPIAVTALLIPVLAVALRVAPSKTAFAGFGDPILFLFLGTFLITDAMAEHGLNARLSRAVLGSAWVRGRPTRILWAVAIVGCLLSAWINNTATAALLVPFALTAEGRVPRRLLVCILLMASYGPSLGGLATPVGTPPNLIGLRLLEVGTGERITFAHWCFLFGPLALGSALLTAGYLRLLGGRASSPRSGPGPSPGADAPPRQRAAAEEISVPSPRGPLSLAERLLIAVVALVVAIWVLPGILLATVLPGAPWLEALSTRLPETSAPLLGGILLFLLPSGTGARRILETSAFRRLDWGTLLLFGGGLSLGTLLLETGLARAIGELLFASVPARGEIGIILASAVLGVLVSETTSNTASASLVVPVVIALAQTAGVDAMKPALAATVACSFGFMLPVSTPPNALVFATGRIRIIEMVRYGLLLDVVGIALVTLWMGLLPL